MKQIIDIELPVFLIAMAGHMFGKRKKIDLHSINDFLIYLATPALILSSLSRNTIEIYLAGEVFLSVLIIIGASMAVCFLAIKALKLPIKVYLPPALFANTGNMGLLLVYSTIAGVLLSSRGGWCLYPWAVELLGEASIPIMIFALGYKLSEIALTEVNKSFIVCGMRLIIWALIGMLAVSIFRLEGVVASVLILQSAMPPAIINFVLAENTIRTRRE